MTQKINFNNLRGDSLTIGNTVITGTGVQNNGESVAGVRATIYANNASLPRSGLTAGQYAFSTANSTLFYTNGSGWYKVTTINQTPSITLSANSVTLESANVADLNYTVDEPEGTPVTISVSNSGIANTSVANVELFLSNNTIRFNKLSEDFLEANVIVSASDGINIGIAFTNIIDVFVPPTAPTNYTSLYAWTAIDMSDQAFFSTVADSSPAPETITCSDGNWGLFFSSSSVKQKQSDGSTHRTHSTRNDVSEYIYVSTISLSWEDTHYSGRMSFRIGGNDTTNTWFSMWRESSINLTASTSRFNLLNNQLAALSDGLADFKFRIDCPGGGTIESDAYTINSSNVYDLYWEWHPPTAIDGNYGFMTLWIHEMTSAQASTGNGGTVTKLFGDYAIGSPGTYSSTWSMGKNGTIYQRQWDYWITTNTLYGGNPQPSDFGWLLEF